MKKGFLIATAVCSTLAFTACNSDEKKTDTVMTSDTTAVTTPVNEVAQYAATEGMSTNVAIDKVPTTVRTSFTTKYPKAQNIVWVQYEPVESDYLLMDSTYYYVRFNDNGADYITWYDNRGEWVKTSTKVPGNANLPDAVNKTIIEQFPGYTIEEINKENDKNMDMYEIKLNKGDQKAKVKILPTGEIFKRK